MQMCKVWHSHTLSYVGHGNSAENKHLYPLRKFYLEHATCYELLATANMFPEARYWWEVWSGTLPQVSLTALECLRSRLLVLLLDTKLWGKMEAPSRGPSTCVVLDHWKDGGGEEDTMRFTHTCFSGGQRWSIPSPCGKCLETSRELCSTQTNTLITHRFDSIQSIIAFYGGGIRSCIRAKCTSVSSRISLFASLWSQILPAT